MNEKVSDKVLAYRIYPLPNGTRYYSSDLLKSDLVKSIFDACQILEAHIFKDGWYFLINNYTLQELYNINLRSGWFDVDNIIDFEKELMLYIEDLTD